jgi:BirA family biotin operon repressor/biotin-[acetyl-CoA-carboxylase] ligase
MQQLNIGENIIWLNEVESTNTHIAFLAQKNAAEGVVVAAKFQTEGKGQRGNVWESQSGMNLTFSVLLHPSFLPVKNQFLISKITALAICDTLDLLVGNTSIKWPNDIYVGDNKISGILIENSFSSHLMDVSIIGIGLNVNQKTFSDDIPNPTSLHILTQRLFKLDNLLKKLCSALSSRYHQLKCNNIEAISNDYFCKLYRKDSYYTYMANDVTFRAKIFGVRDSGELLLKTDSDEVREFCFKEVSFVSE